MIKVVCFDFDGVVYFEKERVDTRLSRDFGIPREKIAEFFKNEFIDCQNGSMDLKVAIKPYLKKWNYPHSIETLLEYWFSNGEINTELINLIKELRKKKFITILVTNNEKTRFDYMENKYHLSKIFEFIIASCEIKKRKPSEEFFKAITTTTHAKPDNIIFFEDEEKIIQKAKEFGFQVYKYKDVKTTKDELLHGT